MAITRVTTRHNSYRSIQFNSSRPRRYVSASVIMVDRPHAPASPQHTRPPTSPNTNTTLIPTGPNYPHPHQLKLTLTSPPPPPLVHTPKLRRRPVSQHQSFVDSFASQGFTPTPVASSIIPRLLTPMPSASTSTSSSLALPQRAPLSPPHKAQQPHAHPQDYILPRHALCGSPTVSTPSFPGAK